MFDWFKNIGRPKYPTWDDVPPPNDMEKIAEDMHKVIPFPELKAAPEPTPEPEKSGRVYYRFGVTDTNRVAFQVGYSEITMNKEGCQNLIDKITFFMNQLEDDTEE